jgi:hypothetical protein
VRLWPVRVLLLGLSALDAVEAFASSAVKMRPSHLLLEEPETLLSVARRLQEEKWPRPRQVCARKPGTRLMWETGVQPCGIWRQPQSAQEGHGPVLQSVYPPVFRRDIVIFPIERLRDFPSAPVSTSAHEYGNPCRVAQKGGWNSDSDSGISDQADMPPARLGLCAAAVFPASRRIAV